MRAGALARLSDLSLPPRRPPSASAGRGAAALKLPLFAAPPVIQADAGPGLGDNHARGRFTRRPLPIDGLRAFEVPARLGSFERAADELAVTASAVGKRIAALEDLDRHAVVHPRAQGPGTHRHRQEYLAQVGAALGLLAAVPLHRRTAQRLEKLRVSAPPTFARQILVPALERYTAAHPAVELEIVLSIPRRHLDVAGPPRPMMSRCATAIRCARRHAAAGSTSRCCPWPRRLLPAPGPLRTERPTWRNAPLLRTPLEPWAPGWFAAARAGLASRHQGRELVDLGMALEAAVSGQGVECWRGPPGAPLAGPVRALRLLFNIPARRRLAPHHYLLPHAARAATGRRLAARRLREAACRGGAALQRLIGAGFARDLKIFSAPPADAIRHRRQPRTGDKR